MTSLQYLGALIDAADLEKNLGDPVLAQRYQSRANHVRSGIASKCWVPSRGLLAENPDRKVFSQQANILGVLYDVIPREKQQEVLRTSHRYQARRDSGRRHVGFLLFPFLPGPCP